jgi:uncharacterized protein involved in outer membrane biogenesis
VILARLFVFLGGLLVLALTAALVVPHFVDWTSYRADFEREASAILGRKVTVQGTASARLLPFPSVTFADVTVGQGADGSAAMTVDTFSMDAELAPFLSGEILIFDMRMERPHAVVAVDDDGTIDWAVRPSAPVDAAKVRLEKLAISGGEIEIRHKGSGQVRRLGDIEAELSAKSLAGPWRIDGTMSLEGQRGRLSASTGVADATGRLRLRMRIEPETLPVVAEMDGEVESRAGGLAYAGTFRAFEPVKKTDTDAAAAKDARSPPPSYRVNGTFQLDARRLDVSAFRLETGPLEDPYSADGVASLQFSPEPRFLVQAKGAQLRFDDQTGEGGGTLSFADRLQAVDVALRRLPKPGIAGRIEVDLPAVLVGDTMIRDVALAAEPTVDGWTIGKASAVLPGRSTLEASGLLRTGERFGFTGDLLLAVAQPSGFAAWIDREIDDSIRRLPAAGFSAKVEIDDRRQLFRNLELQLGDATFRGEVDMRQPAGLRSSVFVRLDGGRLDADGASAFASLFVNEEGRNRFTRSDLDVQVKAGPFAIAGMTADTLDAALRLRGDRLEIDRLSIGGVAGASVSAVGVLDGLPSRPEGKLDVSVVSPDLAPLVGVLHERYPDQPALAGLASRSKRYAGLLGDARLDMVATAAASPGGGIGLAISLQGDAGGSALSATLSAERAGDGTFAPPVNLTVSARNADATVLMAAAGLPALPLGAVGPGELTASVSGSAFDRLNTKIELRSEDRFLATFDGVSTYGGDGVSASGQVKVKSEDVEPWIMTLGASLPGMGLGTGVDIAAKADVADGLLVLQGIDGAIGEVAVAGDLNAEIRDGRPNLTGALTLDELALDPLAAMMLGSDAVAPADTIWPEAPFARAPAMPVTADLDIVAATLTGGSQAAYDTSFALHLGPGALRLEDVKATLADGSLTGRMELKNTDGTGLLSVQGDLSGADIQTLLPGGLSGKADLSATLTGSGKSISAMVASLAGSGRALGRELTVSGVNALAFADLIAAADAVGRDIDAPKTAGFASRIASAGTFAARDTAEMAFTVAGGIVRAPPVSIVSDSATLSSDLRVDLAAASVDASGTLLYRAGDEQVTGAEPALRFAATGWPGAMRMTFDSEPLAQFLTQRALEREQARVEALQAVLLERQRLRREVRYYAALQQERDRVAEEKRRAEEEEALRKAEEEARIKAEDKARRQEAEKAQGAAGHDAAEPPVDPTPPQAPEPSSPPADAGAAEPEAPDPVTPSNNIPVPAPKADAPRAVIREAPKPAPEPARTARRPQPEPLAVEPPAPAPSGLGSLLKTIIRAGQ